MTVTTTAVMEAVEEEVAVSEGLGWLKGSMPNVCHEGGGTVSVVPFGIRNCAPTLPGHILGSFGGTDENEDVITESFGYPDEITGMCRISDSR